MPIVSSESLGLAAEKRKQEKKDKEEAQKLAKTNGGAAGDATPTQGEAMEEGEKWGDEDEDPGALEGDEWGDEVEREAKRART